MSFKKEDHTFVVCAFKESTYLEKCVKSVVNQTIKSNVIISTSTPNEHINTIATKYNLKVIVNKGIGDICNNFNFALQNAETPLVTLCHQDDEYSKFYLEYLIKNINNKYKPLLYFTDYHEIVNDKIIKRNLILIIKRIMLTPLLFKVFQKNIFIRKFILSLGCAICCPSVTFVKENLKLPIFKENNRSNLDWYAWIEIASYKGSFIYCNKPMAFHRIHKESLTSKVIDNSLRLNEDYEMFSKFWPKPIAKLINNFYSFSQNSNKKKK